MRKLCFVLPGISLFTLAFLLASGAAAVYAQEPQKPGPEQKKMEVWAGEWSYAGDDKEPPFGKQGHFTGKMITRMLANGFVLEHRAIEKDGDWLDLWWYDPVVKGYVFQSFEPSGVVSSGSVTVDGNTWTATGTRLDAKGKRLHLRATLTLSPNGKTCSVKQEYSLDEGKTWSVWYELIQKKLGK